MENVLDKINSFKILDKKDLNDIIDYYVDKYSLREYLTDIVIKDNRIDSTSLAEYKGKIITIYWNDLLRTGYELANKLNCPEEYKSIYVNYIILITIIHEMRHCVQLMYMGNFNNNHLRNLLAGSFCLYNTTSQEIYDSLYEYLPIERDAYSFSYAEGIDFYSKLYNIDTKFFKILIRLEKASLASEYRIINKKIFSPLDSIIEKDSNYVNKEISNILLSKRNKLIIPLYYRFIMGLDIDINDMAKLSHIKEENSRKSVRTKMLRFQEKI